MHQFPLCTYCQRRTVASSVHSPLALTADHRIPRSKGGTKTLPSCWGCNNLKGDMTPEEWQAFMAANPRWWEMPQFKRRPGLQGSPRWLQKAMAVWVTRRRQRRYGR